MMTPDAKQNRLSNLVKLVLDKFRKGICNEALKTQFRKDSAAFCVADMPTYIQRIGKFLGSRTLQEVTRHRCGKALIEFYKEIRTLSIQGFYIHDPERGPWLHKPFPERVSCRCNG